MIKERYNIEEFIYNSVLVTIFSDKEQNIWGYILNNKEDRGWDDFDTKLIAKLEAKEEVDYMIENGVIIQ